MRSYSTALFLSVVLVGFFERSPVSLVAEIPDDRVIEATEFLTSARVTLTSAIWAAAHEHPCATPFRAEISKVRPTHAYSVFLLTESGVLRCDVDAGCGEVLGSADAPVKDTDELRRVTRKATVSLLDAVAFAERQTRGKPFHAELQPAGGKARAVIELLSQGRVIEFPLHRIPTLKPTEFVQSP
jgi:hypothetical protein